MFFNVVPNWAWAKFVMAGSQLRQRPPSHLRHKKKEKKKEGFAEFPVGDLLACEGGLPRRALCSEKALVAQSIVCTNEFLRDSGKTQQSFLLVYSLIFLARISWDEEQSHL